jgi:hypothetical protein
MVRCVFKNDKVLPTPDAQREAIGARIRQLFQNLVDNHDLQGSDFEWEKADDGSNVGREYEEQFPAGCGFIPYYDDRYVSVFYGLLSYMDSTGASCYFGHDFQQECDKMHADAREAFIHERKEELTAIYGEDFDEDDVHYHSLHEKCQVELAEELSEYESEWVGGSGAQVQFQLQALVYLAGNNNGNRDFSSGTVRFWASWNDESPYFREKYDNDKYHKEMSIDEFMACDLAELEKEMVKEIKSHSG